jgi:riboflavin kinase/FMN adenylyltransferase
MEVFQSLTEYRPPAGGIALTIGNFDGVHLGHRKIVERMLQIGGQRGLPSVVMTFDPHPVAVLAPERAPARLINLSEKIHLLAELQVGACIVLRTERRLLALMPEEFLKVLARHCRPRAIIEGLDFNFGRGRQGSVRTLSEFADRLGYTVEVVETARCEQLAGAPSVHSSAVRAALREGRVDVARAMLGRPYRISGMVGSGAGRGAGLGFPTANLHQIVQMLPQEAVYAAVAQLEDDSLHLAAVNVGPQPTFGDSHARVEAHVLDWHNGLAGRRMGLPACRSSVPRSRATWPRRGPTRMPCASSSPGHCCRCSHDPLAGCGSRGCHSPRRRRAAARRFS